MSGRNQSEWVDGFIGIHKSPCPPDRTFAQYRSQGTTRTIFRLSATGNAAGSGVGWFRSPKINQVNTGMITENCPPWAMPSGRYYRLSQRRRKDAHFGPERTHSHRASAMRGNFITNKMSGQTNDRSMPGFNGSRLGFLTSRLRVGQARGRDIARHLTP
jgi:hypothetical protein